MQAETIEIVRLEPMRVARVWAFAPNPEEQAWQKLTAFAGPRGLLTAGHRIFGFNNPNPSAGSPNYGYEYWITVDGDVAPAVGGGDHGGAGRAVRRASRRCDWRLRRDDPGGVAAAG
jgi:hypothetical protein